MSAPRLRGLLAGSREVVPYEDGEKVYLYCGKACRVVEHTVIARYAGKPYALCGHGGCTRKAPDLPKRYRVNQAVLQSEAARALPALLDALASRDARLAAVEALHIRRECLVYDDEECADGTCEHPTGTCVVLSPAVCAHCADQTEPGGGWEHLIREAAYWPCATTRALRSDPDEATT